MAKEPDAFVPETLFESGIGEVVVVRYKSGGRAEAGVFLVDLFCLGVKNAFFVSQSEHDTQKMLDKMAQRAPMIRHPASYGRKLVEDAVKYARGLGLEPHPDYKKAARVFGGIDPAQCAEKFVFGRDGKPFFVNGPHISYEQSTRIIQHLEARCGAGNFDYLIGPSELDEDTPEEGPVILLSDSESDGGEVSAEMEDLADEIANMAEFRKMQWEIGDKEGFNLARFILNATEILREEMSGTAEDTPYEKMVDAVLILFALCKMDEETRTRVLSQAEKSIRVLFDSFGPGMLDQIAQTLPPVRVLERKFYNAAGTENKRPRLLLAYMLVEE